MPVLWVIFGGGLGAGLRYIVSGKFYGLLGPNFPWGTLAVNIIGSFLIGVLSEFFSYLSVGSEVRMFVLVGLLGGFTTFSSFSLETINLFRDGEFLLAWCNITANNFLSILSCGIGFVGSSYVFELIRRLL